MSGSDSTAERITVYADSKLGQTRPLIGFVHGITYDSSKNYDRTIELITALKPRFWRSSNFGNSVYGFISKGDFVKTCDTTLMFVIQDAIHNQFGFNIKIDPDCPAGKSNCFRTFDDFKAAWEKVTSGIVKGAIQRNVPIKYFEIFGEPINAGFGKVNTGTGITGITPEQLLELYKTSHNIIRAAMPAAKIGGPGWIAYNKQVLTGFLDYIVKENLPLDFVSWHEFGDEPGDVVSHVAEVRDLIKARPQLCSPKSPEIHITEYSPDKHMHIPATGLAWAYYLEKAGVDWATKAAWGVINPIGKNWDCCWAGFNGVMLKDNTTTTDMYWVYRMYTDMNKQRIRTECAKPRTVAISDRNDSQKELKILVGRYGYEGAAGDVKVSIEEYPFGNGRVSAEIWKVPSNGKLYHLKALAKPIQIESQELDVANRAITLTIDSFKDGEVYYLILRPK
ncbi:MAG: hypothetical protein HZA50_04170 [Planctomycetes bacterium]|nr:hypothetical protein [Planctomycetota bacterium]